MSWSDAEILEAARINMIHVLSLNVLRLWIIVISTSICRYVSKCCCNCFWRPRVWIWSNFRHWPMFWWWMRWGFKIESYLVSSVSTSGRASGNLIAMSLNMIHLETLKRLDIECDEALRWGLDCYHERVLLPLCLEALAKFWAQRWWTQSTLRCWTWRGIRWLDCQRERVESPLCGLGLFAKLLRLQWWKQSIYILNVMRLDDDCYRIVNDLNRHCVSKFWRLQWWIRSTHICI